MDSFEAEVTFIPKSDGGRSTLPLLDLDYSYRPHIVMGDIGQRKAIMEGNYITEPYIGVAFRSSPEKVEFDKAFPAKLALVYSHPDYAEMIVEGATFTLREGALIIGYGVVTRSLSLTAEQN